MNKSFFTTTVLMLVSFPHISTFGMEPQTQLTIDSIRKHTDIGKILTNQLGEEDRADMRLVCKDWASKNKDWLFMPDSIEKKYDKIIKRKITVTPIHKKIILFSLAAEKDFKGTQWIIHNKNDGDRLSLHNPWLTNKCKLSAYMVAVHNHDPEMARLLFESNATSKDRCWKTYYNTITIPQEIEQCLYPSHNRDFSFLLYLTAVLMDNTHNLKKLYSHKVPTTLGQTLLIHYSLKHNAHKCFKELLTNKAIKEIIAKHRFHFFELAISSQQEKLPRILIKKKLFYLNAMVIGGGYTKENPGTILDYYYSNEELKKDYKAIELLIHFGAKQWKDVSQ